MKKIGLFGVLALLGACGAAGDPLQPTAGLGIGIGPGGISLKPRVTVSNGTTRVSAGTGGVSAGVSSGPVSLGASL